jgi:hypothetical protein
MTPLAPMLTAAVAKACRPVGPGMRSTPSWLAVAPMATISGVAVIEADSSKVLSPVWLGAGRVLAQSNTSGISVASKAALGVMPNTKLWLPPAGMSTGVLGVPIS